MINSEITHQHTIKVQVFRCARVVSTLVLKFCIFVQCVQHFWLNLKTNETKAFVSYETAHSSLVSRVKGKQSDLCRKVALTS